MDSENKKITIAVKNQDAVSFFDKDTDFVFIYKKTEKLSTAVYMITNLFPNEEPIKWKLRNNVSNLLSFMLDYKGITESNRFDFVYSVKTMVLELCSLLEISSGSGLLSQMNFSIIKNEFINLVNKLETLSITQKEAQYGTISKTFFDDTNTLQSSNTSSYQDSTLLPKIVTEHSKLSFKNTKTSSSVNTGFKKTNRQNIIIDILKRRKEATIKDITEIIKDCSEKTVQRELILLIKLRVIKRIGERRWSKYSLII